MILVVGGTGRLGSRLVQRLAARGDEVRILSRRPGTAPQAAGIEMVQGDLRDQESVVRAVRGVGTVVAAAHGFAGPGLSPTTIDWQGNQTLIGAAQSAGVGHFVLVSVVGASSDHPMELFRMKARAEAALRKSSLPWTIVRATAFMETWLALVGEPLIRTGKTRVFGRGRNPINFVSAEDAAAVIEMAVFDPASRQRVIEIGGPEDLSWTDFTAIVQEVSARQGKVTRVPRPVLRAMSLLMRPLNPTMAGQVKAAVVMDTTDMTLNAPPHPGAAIRIGSVRLADVVRRDYVEATAAVPAP